MIRFHSDLWSYKYFRGRIKVHRLVYGFEDTFRRFCDRFSCDLFNSKRGLEYMESAPIEGMVGDEVIHQLPIPHNVTVKQMREAIEKSVDHNYLYDLLKGQKEV